MLLTIDVGNTNIVFALLDGDKIIYSWRQPTNPEIDILYLHDDYNVELKKSGVQKVLIKNAIIASVVPKLTSKLKNLIKREIDKNPLIVGEPGVDLGIDIDVDDPQEVGADRLVNSIAGFQKYGGPLIILDFGTATTFDVISNTGAYLGGVICPGINLSLEALSKAAAKLPKLTAQVPKTNIVTGKNTVDAMQSGIYWGYMGLIEGLIERLRNEHGEETIVLGTGGLVEMFSQKTTKINFIDRDLTVKGLQIIFNRNKK